MKTSNIIPELPFSISNNNEFNAKCIEIFHYQFENNKVYQKYVKSIGVDLASIISYMDIPFLPIQFFKSQKVICGDDKFNTTFKSSGTGGARSRHLVKDIAIYEQSFINCFLRFFGNPEEYAIIALLPNYTEQGDSSLVYMVNKLITLSANIESGFYLEKIEDLLTKISILEKHKKVLLIGVTYALLDLIAHGRIKLKNTTVIETGGMKGKRKELVREELHGVLRNAFGVNYICSEYGMTELLSQAYMMGDGKFRTPLWMKVLVRDVYDPLTLKKTGRGGINVIDLANIYSCSFIATQDIGITYNDNSFEVLGRFDNSDIRGCNLLTI